MKLLKSHIVYDNQTDSIAYDLRSSDNTTKIKALLVKRLQVGFKFCKNFITVS